MKCLPKENCDLQIHHKFNETTNKCDYCSISCNKTECNTVIISSYEDLEKPKCSVISRLEIVNLNDTNRVDLHEKLTEFFSTLSKIKTCAIIKNSPGIKALKIFQPLMQIFGSCEYEGKNYSMIVVDNENLQSLFIKANTTKLKNGILVKNNKNLCKIETEVLSSMGKVNMTASKIQETECVFERVNFQVILSNATVTAFTNALSDDSFNQSLICVDTSNDSDDEIKRVDCQSNFCELTDLKPSSEYACNVKIENGEAFITTSKKFIRTDNEIKIASVDFDANKLTFHFEKNNQTHKAVGHKFVLTQKIKDDATNQSDEDNSYIFKDTLISNLSLTEALEISVYYINSTNLTIRDLKSSTSYEIVLLSCISANVLTCRKLSVETFKTKDENNLIMLFLFVTFMFLTSIAYVTFVISKTPLEDKNMDDSTTENIPYENLKEWEVDRSQIEDLYPLGDGNFGEVFKGYFNKNGKESVAIKTVKITRIINISDEAFLKRREEQEKNFLKEAVRMTQLDSHHIVKLKGLCIKERPYWVLMEYMEHGELRIGKNKLN